MGAAVGLIIFLAAAIALSAEGGNKTITNPDAGLTDAQRAQNYSSGRDAFNARYQQWLASIDFSKVNYASLKRVPLNALYESPQPSLSAAKAHAELILVGKVRAIRPTAFDGTYVTLDIDGLMKGSASASVIIHQAGGLRPTPDWKGMFIAYALDEPLLIPNDRAVLFLNRGSTGTLEVQGFTGLYRSTGGRVSAVAGNPFAQDVDGRSEVDFIATVKAQA